MIQSKKRWHVIRFNIKIIENLKQYNALVNRGNSSLHTLIANEVLRPSIEKYGENGENIYPWRFHREFNPQNKKHLFTFRFCTLESSTISDDMKADIEANSSYQEIKNLSLLIDTVFNEKGADGDQSWPIEINQSWPHFICGVSRAWLEMIKAFEKDETIKKFPIHTFENKLQFYDRINKRIEEQWLNFGHHSMLHHLNAVFGYAPTKVKIGRGFGIGDIRSLSTHLGSLPTNAGDFAVLLGLEGLVTF